LFFHQLQLYKKTELFARLFAAKLLCFFRAVLLQPHKNLLCP